MEEKFSDIIEKGETIVKAYKPNKKKYWWGVGLCLFFTSFWAVVLLIFSLIASNDFLTDEDGVNGKIPLIIISSIWIAGSLLSIIFACLNYKNKFYCYTDRRIIVRSGIFGVDYASLEFKSLTATMVMVSLLDKILRTQTGTIKFGSASSQISGGSSTAGGVTNPYTFRHIEKPYDVMREIKEHINKKS
jgi:hypothetical protein